MKKIVPQELQDIEQMLFGLRETIRRADMSTLEERRAAYLKVYQVVEIYPIAQMHSFVRGMIHGL